MQMQSPISGCVRAMADAGPNRHSVATERSRISRRAPAETSSWGRVPRRAQIQHQHRDEHGENPSENPFTRSGVDPPGTAALQCALLTPPGPSFTVRA